MNVLHSMKPIKRLLTIIAVCIITGLLTAAVFYQLGHGHNDADSERRLANHFNDEFSGLNPLLIASGFTLGTADSASCGIGSPNSGLGGEFICNQSRNGSLEASPRQVNDWAGASLKIKSYLSERGWKSRVGYRNDITYGSLPSMFETAKSGPVVVMYNKRFPDFVCRLVFDVNREYPYHNFNRVDVSESCDNAV